jgi:hypothetical protein
LFKVGIGLGGAVRFFEQVVHGLGFLVGCGGSGIALPAGFKVGALLGRELAVQRGDDQVVQRIVRGGFSWRGCGLVTARA